MTDRKKKGVGLLITGALSATVGIVLMIFTQSPEWLATVILVAGAISQALGFVVVYPDID